eukprot:TRINITY_DN78978_c0_g1_i1.p1 TRINITY_DN78978_c0_g1~~TRINITY_DN78978_c0_g1_i1.p1  ORF type:complete len:114 (+),score=36.70 TRINITY_DN78978_c0_g1_i1:88-429(+)
MAEDLMAFDASPAEAAKAPLETSEGSAKKTDDFLSSFDPLMGSAPSSGTPAPSSLGLPDAVAAAFQAPASQAPAASALSAEEQQKQLLQAMQEDAAKMRGGSAKPADDPFQGL